MVQQMRLMLIEAAIQKVSDQRSKLGAVQNRLEHTVANLDNVVENTTSAESRIRDTDMAEEMVSYSKNNISYAGRLSMLAQANQQNQGVLFHFFSNLSYLNDLNYFRDFRPFGQAVKAR